jgi:predicted TPR repeat methyltransferase
LNNTSVPSHSSSAFFEKKYQQHPDPWNFSSDAYELRRYGAIVSALTHQHYKSAFEPGCSIGVLTEQLAEFCDRVEAIDFSPTAVVQAQIRCERLNHVTVRCAMLNEASVESVHDLLVLCEIGYYFSSETWKSLSSALIEAMHDGGTVVVAHWLGTSKDHETSGDEVHGIVLSNSLLQLQHSERHHNFRLDRLVRR